MSADFSCISRYASALRSDFIFSKSSTFAFCFSLVFLTWSLALSCCRLLFTADSLCCLPGDLGCKEMIWKKYILFKFIKSFKTRTWKWNLSIFQISKKTPYILTVYPSFWPVNFRLPLCTLYVHTNKLSKFLGKKPFMYTVQSHKSL